MDRVFPYHQPILHLSRHQLGVLHFSSFLTLTTGSSHRAPQVSGPVPRDCPPFRHRSQVLGTHTSVWLGYKVGASNNPSPHFRFNNLLEWLTELGKFLLSVVYYKGCKWTVRWRGTLGEVQKVPKLRSFCPCGVGMYPRPSTEMCSPARSSLTPMVYRILWRYHYISMIHYIIGHWSLNSISNPSGNETESSNPFITRLVPQATRPHCPTI